MDETQKKAVAQEVGKIMGKLKNACLPKTIEEWEQLASDYNDELTRIEKERDDLLAALGRCTVDGRPDFKGFANALRAEASWESEIKRGDKTGQASTDIKQLHELAEKVEKVGKDQGYL